VTHRPPDDKGNFVSHHASGILKVAGAVAGVAAIPLTGGFSAVAVGAAVGFDVGGGVVGHDSAAGIAGSAVLDLATAGVGAAADAGKAGGRASVTSHG